MTSSIPETSLLLAAFRSANLAEAADRCSVATLRQTYGYRISGVVGEAAPFLPFTTVGTQTFDGAGRFTAKNALAMGPEITRDFTFRGTYTVNPDCTGDHDGGFRKDVLRDCCERG